MSRQGYRQLRRFAAHWPDAEWAIEGATGLGAPLATWLSGDGIEAVDVPAKLAARVRMLSTGHGRKNDDADAVSVGIAALTAPGLRSAVVEDAIITLRALVEHRDDIVRTRTQTVNRLHVLLTGLLPGGAPRQLDADTAARLLSTVRPRATGPAHYNTQRPHRALQLRPLRPKSPGPEPIHGRIRRRPVLGGLINEYEPVA